MQIFPIYLNLHVSTIASQSPPKKRKDDFLYYTFAQKVKKKDGEKKAEGIEGGRKMISERLNYSKYNKRKKKKSKKTWMENNPGILFLFLVSFVCFAWSSVFLGYSVLYIQIISSKMTFRRVIKFYL